jgi:DNA-directed RNA polymerase subunit RPC12/RpoP
MGERKVLNKYFPPDFDPAKLPKKKRNMDNYMKVRMMMAMSIQCQTCGVFISKGTKFNMRKEDVIGEDYLGIEIHRFYFKCPHCSTEITFKTDPMINDYMMEHGAHRTVEPLKKRQEAIIVRKNNYEKNDSVKVLVCLADHSKREIDILTNLEKLRAKMSISRLE